MENFNVESNSQTPIYQQVAEWVKLQIAKGKWSAGEKIPSEEEFVSRLKVSRGTIRKAIALLADEEVLTKIQGKGTFVSEQKISYPFGQELISFSETMQAKEINYSTKVIEKVIIPSTNFLQKKLNLKIDEKVFLLKRIRYVDGIAAMYLENYLSADKFKDIEKRNFEENSLFKVMEEIMGSTISKGIRDFSASLVDEELSILLNLEVGIPILKFDQVTFNEKNEPIEYSKIFLRTDKYQVTSELSR